MKVLDNFASGISPLHFSLAILLITASTATAQGVTQLGPNGQRVPATLAHMYEHAFRIQSQMEQQANREERNGRPGLAFRNVLQSRFQLSPEQFLPFEAAAHQFNIAEQTIKVRMVEAVNVNKSARNNSPLDSREIWTKMPQLIAEREAISAQVVNALHQGLGQAAAKQLDASIRNLYSEAQAGQANTVTPASYGGCVVDPTCIYYDDDDDVPGPPDTDDGGGGADPPPACPSTITLASTTSEPLAPTVPKFFTGIGIVAAMQVNPTTTDWADAQITESLVTTSNTCPSGWGNPCGQSSTFTVGDGGTAQNGQVFPPIQNQFYDEHATVDTVNDLVASGMNACSSVCTQRYSCNGRVIGTFTITKSYTRGTVGNYAVTNVTATKH